MDPLEQLSRAWEQLAGRIQGPFVFRFVLQPAVAAFLAVRAGVADARHGRAPYLWTVLSNPLERRQLVRDGFKDISRVFIVAVLLDLIYQLMVFGWIYPIQALLIAAMLALLPYVAIRGPVTRFMARRYRQTDLLHKVEREGE
jgi:hypothetical protein